MHGMKLERLSPEEKEKFYALGKSQIDYILGDSGRSYVVGFGENPPKNPHHRKRFDNRPLLRFISINDRLLFCLRTGQFRTQKDRRHVQASAKGHADHVMTKVKIVELKVTIHGHFMAPSLADQI